MKVKCKNQKGQALLFVVVAVTIALAVGVSVSSRNLDMSRRISRTDTSTRVTAAAEGGIERLLVVPESFLEGLEDADPDCSEVGVSSGDGACFIEFEPTEGDNITSRAKVDAEKFILNSDDHYWFELSPGYVKEINLEGYTGSDIRVCWDSIDTALYYINYDTNGGIEKGGIQHNAFSYSGNVSGFSTVGGGNGTYDVCADINLMSDSYGLRLKALFGAAKFGVYPIGGDLPYQGYKIISIGELSVDSEVKEVKTVIVYKSFPYMPSFMDYGIYTNENLD